MIIKIKKRGNLIITLFFLQFIPLPVIAEQQETANIKETLIAKIDSCNNNLLELDQKQRLSMIKIANQSGEHIILSNFFRRKKLFGDEYQILMSKHIPQNNFDSIYFYYKKADNYYLNNKEDSKLLIYSLSEQFLFWCINYNYSELAINTLKKDIEYKAIHQDDHRLRTYLNLVMVYSTKGNHKQVIESAKNGLKVKDDVSSKASLLKPTLCVEIAEGYLSLNNYQKSLAYSDSALVYAQKSFHNSPTYLNDFLNLASFTVHMHKSICYSDMQNFAQASLMLNKMDTSFVHVINSKIAEVENIDQTYYS